MRQFLSPRFWLALAALAGMALALGLVFKSPSSPAGVQADDADARPERRIDLVSWVYLITPEAGFALDDGITTADLVLQLDGTRTMVVKAGTPGEIDCPALTEVATCTVAADLLGDAVLWFSVIPGRPGATVTLPAVTEMLEGAWVRLANDWVVRRDDIIDRSCPEDTSSLSDFIGAFGVDATSTFNFEAQQVVKVTCLDPDDTPTTDSVPLDTAPATSVIVGTETEDDSVPSTSSSAPATP